MDIDGFIDLVKGREMSELEYKSRLKSFIERSAARLLDYHCRQLHRKRSNFRVKLSLLKEKEYKDFRILIEDYIYERKKEMKYGKNWNEKLGYGK
jgi:hypothetical protein